jgi:hypothetical protein
MNAGITTKGAAQHNPFIALAFAGHLTLFFILLRIKENDPLNLAKSTANVRLKLATQITR